MITIRQYHESDAPTLWSLFYHTIRHVNRKHYSQAEVEAWAPDEFDAKVWLKKMNALDPFIAEIDGEIVGYTDLQESGLIDHFFCHHQHQGKGVGRALMEHVLETGRSRGIAKFRSEVSITARPFYEHFGFEVVEEQVVALRGEKLRNFIMVKCVKPCD